MEALAFSSNGQSLAAGSGQGVIRVWDQLRQVTERIYETPDSSGISSLSFSLDGSTIASGLYDGRILLWNVPSRKVIGTLAGHSGQILSLGYLPDGNHVISASADNSVVVWDTGTRQRALTVMGFTDPVNAVAFSSDGKMLAAGAPQLVTIWGIHVTGDGVPTEFAPLSYLLADQVAPTAALTAVFFGGPPSSVAAGYDDGEALVWDLETGSIIKHLAGESANWSWKVAFRDGDSLIAAKSLFEGVILQDVLSGQRTRSLIGLDMVSSIAFSPDGHTLAVGYRNGRGVLWGSSDGKVIRTLEGPGSQPSALSFSADGVLLAAGYQSGSVRLWDLSKGAILNTVTAHGQSVTGLAFSPDAHSLATSSFDMSVSVWNTSTGGRTRLFTGHSGGVMGVAFSPDGGILTSCSSDGTIILWTDLE